MKTTITEPTQVRVLERRLKQLTDELAGYRGNTTIPWKRQQLLREEIYVTKRRLRTLGGLQDGKKTR